MNEIKIIWIRDVHRTLKSLNPCTTPHITISKTRTSEMLQNSYEFFRSKNYTKYFEVSQLVLVSRYENKTWDWEHRIDLTH
ncbi:hypothetical protein [Aestuariibaculum suncheonense]|uniref:Uncharacterized protein n=1 Tax=Aestuariibaculum suncheonense TaxID=1028745 RepID=A0A8J6UBI3_9FLAO|nr:hypothetical protein [Aestuariibaculum suncheonense]MBD0835487.1 hypothetical protein [Aestuariibaculum suncheonense]